MTITIAKADPDPASHDSKLIWEWRNDPVTRQMSRTTDAISWEDHQAWYAGAHGRIVIASVDGVPASVMRFDRIGPRHAEININLNPAMRGKGLGAPILISGCMYAFDNLRFDKIRAEIKPDNLPSINIFEMAAFVFTGIHDGLRRYELKRP